MVRLNWTHQAVNDLKDIADYVSKDSRRYANLLIRRIQDKVRLLKTQPDSGRMVDEFERPDIKELLEGNYRIIYRRVNSSRIEILTIHHSARNLRSRRIKK
jgi:addiction module RelE/StbE family toxin